MLFQVEIQDKLWILSIFAATGFANCPDSFVRNYY